MELKRSTVRGNDVRIPSPDRGVALVIERYSSERAIVIHPDDFLELQAESTMLEEIARGPESELGELGAKAHSIVESPEAELIEDESAIRERLGL